MINSVNKVNEWLLALGLADTTKLEASFLRKEIGEEIAEELKCELFNLFLNILEVRLKNGSNCSFKQSELDYLSQIEECNKKDFSNYLQKIFIAGVSRKEDTC